MDAYGEMPPRRRRAVGGGPTDQYNMGLRDPMVHQIKGQMAAEKAMEGRGTSAAQYRQLQNASHAHMKGGRPQLAGGGFISDLGIPIVSNLAGMIGLGVTGGRAVGAGTKKGEMRMTARRAYEGGMMSGGAPSVAGGGEGMYTERQLNGLARAIGSGKPLGRTHSKMVNSIQGAGFWDDFKSGFMSVVKPVASIAKPFLSMAGPYGAAGAAGLSALGLGKMGDSDSEDEVEVVGGRRTRAKAGPNDARRRRGAMVSKLMKEKGMSLGEASKYIKEHGSA